MSSEPPKMESPMKMPPWDKLDPRLQRTAWILAIILASLTIISNYVIPYYEIFLIIVPQSAFVARNLYQWRKNKNTLIGWHVQPIFLFQLAIAFLQAGFCFSRSAAYPWLMGVLWVCAGFSWAALSVLAAREQFNARLEDSHALWNALLTFSEQQTKLVNTQSTFATNHADMAVLLQLAVEGHSTQRQLVELCHKETATLAANTAKQLDIDKNQLLPEETQVA